MAAIYLAVRQRLGLFFSVLGLGSISGVAATLAPKEWAGAIGGTAVVAAFYRFPVWAAAVSLAISPILDITVRTSTGFQLDPTSLARGLGLAAMLVAILGRWRQQGGTMTPLAWATLWLGLALSSSLFFSVGRLLSVKQVLATMYWAVYLLFVTLSVKREEDIRILLWGQFAAGLAIFITMVPYEIHHVYSTYTNGSLSIYGPYAGGPFNLALSIAFWFPVLRLVRGRWPRVLFIALALGLLDILVHTLVRTAALVVILELGYMAMVDRRLRWWAGGALTAATAAMVVDARLGGAWLGRLLEAHSLNGFSSGRLLLYHVSWQQFLGLGFVHQVFGVGYGNAQTLLHILGVGTFTDPQNDFLNVLLGAGMLGLAGFLAYLATLVWVLGKIPISQHRGHARWIFFLLLLVATINGVFNGETTATLMALNVIAMTACVGRRPAAHPLAPPLSEPSP